MTPLATVLIVDDQPDSLKWLYQILQAHGFRVLLANSGELALQTVGPVAPDLILLDVNMPGMNGFEVCRRLKAEGSTRDIPVLFLSASETADQRIEGFRAGAVDFILKPFTEEEVVLRVQNHWELRRLHLDLEARVRDRTQDLETALEENRFLMRELQHRVKNHLTLVTSLLTLTESSARQDEPALALLEKARSRVQALATVYDLLYRSENLTGVNFAEYAGRLVEPWMDSGPDDHGIRLECRFEPVLLPTEILIPLGLILTELITNALKYAYPEGGPGTIQVALVRRGQEFVLSVQDDGRGLPEGGSQADPGLGWQLVGSLAKQLKGRWTKSSDHGSRVEVAFPEPVKA